MHNLAICLLLLVGCSTSYYHTAPEAERQEFRRVSDRLIERINEYVDLDIQVIKRVPDWVYTVPPENMNHEDRMAIMRKQTRFMEALIRRARDLLARAGKDRVRR